MLGHYHTRFKLLRIDDPAGQVSGIISECSGRQESAAGQVCQVGTDRRTSRGPLDRVTHDASARKEHVLAAFLPIVARSGRIPVLGLQPTVELLLGFCNNGEAHVGML